MGVNNADLYFSSNWDIDQILYQGESSSIDLSVNSGTTPNFISLKTFSLSFPPVVDGTFQLTSDSVWRQFNDASSGDTTLINLLPMCLVCTSSEIGISYFNYNSSTVSINVRWFVWTDEVDH
jgi:hypothetical protein